MQVGLTAIALLLVSIAGGICEDLFKSLLTDAISIPSSYLDGSCIVTETDLICKCRNKGFDSVNLLEQIKKVHLHASSRPI